MNVMKPDWYPPLLTKRKPKEPSSINYNPFSLKDVAAETRVERSQTEHNCTARQG